MKKTTMKSYNKRNSNKTSYGNGGMSGFKENPTSSKTPKHYITTSPSHGLGGNIKPAPKSGLKGMSIRRAKKYV